MANPFDQFDEQPVVSKAVSSVNPFDQFDEPDRQNTFDSFDGPPMAVSHKPVRPEEPTATQKALRVASPYYRVALEGGGAAAGGIAGSGASPIAGTIAGGALGYTMGKRGADWLDEQAGIKKEPTLAELSVSTGKDLLTGATYEMGGMAAVPALQAVYRGGKYVLTGASEPIIKALTTKGAQREAGNILRANTSIGDIYARNADEAQKIEKSIPGLRFSRGQSTNDPSLIKLERAQMRTPGDAATINAEMTAANNEALRSYYQKNFGTDEGVDDLLKFLQAESDTITKNATTASQNVDNIANSIPQSSPENTGAKIVDTLSGAKATAKKQVDKLYDSVPETNVNVSGMVERFKSIVKPMSKYEDEGNVPTILSKVMDDFKDSTKTMMPLDDLRGLRSEITTDLRQAKAATSPNERLISRLKQSVGAIDDAIKLAEDSSAGDALKKANKFFRDDYAGVFKSGTIGNVLTRGSRGELTKIPIGKIPSTIWNNRNLSAADDFLKAADDARNIMRDHAAYDLMQSVTNADGKIVSGKLQSWLARNRPLLKKFGIESDFIKINDAQKAADAASEVAMQFEKSSAGRILQADPERMVAVAFNGNNPAKQASDLMKLVSKDPAAKKGLQREFADHLMDIIQTSAKDVSGNPTVSNAYFHNALKKYGPVMRQIYKGEPEKIRALNTMKRAYEIAFRNKTSPIGGGSDTIENAFSKLGKANFLSRTVSFIKALWSPIAASGEKQANEMVTKALFDPEYAEIILNATRKPIPDDQLTTVFNGVIEKLSKYNNTRKSQALVGSTAIMADGE